MIVSISLIACAAGLSVATGVSVLGLSLVTTLFFFAIFSSFALAYLGLSLFGLLLVVSIYPYLCGVFRRNLGSNFLVDCLHSLFFLHNKSPLPQTVMTTLKTLGQVPSVPNT